MEPAQRIICALDVDNAYRAIQLVQQLRDLVGVFKVGLELVTATGIQIFDKLRDAGAQRIFYDAKLHDIPNTVAGAMRGVARLGVWGVTVHASGGRAMLEAAVQAARQAIHSGPDDATPPQTLVLGVTVLTSIDATALHQELHVADPLEAYVVHLAQLAYQAGCDGVIASPQEIEALRGAVPDPDFLIVTPGVRPAGADPGDQARILTPAEALRRGASYLVIGRPITAAPDPVAAARRIAEEIAHASRTAS
ncbi:MAG: orotidine-5'-phosphate decarboxylase [Chloroherpetonaceae bacterium]|nr:orotidine-5'-phosphate decarboxylase [Chthonomonadaceae bacterium]MDW8208698.1 orotidine-5'-phosphate decarboxylase [Chloroherpetonaceae bacterium]